MREFPPNDFRSRRAACARPAATRSPHRFTPTGDPHSGRRIPARRLALAPRTPGRRSVRRSRREDDDSRGAVSPDADHGRRQPAGEDPAAAGDDCAARGRDGAAARRGRRPSPLRRRRPRPHSPRRPMQRARDGRAQSRHQVDHDAAKTETAGRAAKAPRVAAARLLAPGGLLLYSVCSLEPEETDQVVSALREEDPGMTPVALGEAIPGPLRSLTGPTRRCA